MAQIECLVALSLTVSSSTYLEDQAQAHLEVASVTDGDTFRLDSGERIRIFGIDAPETAKHQARCPREIELGKAATLELRALLLGQNVIIERVGKSYARTVARVTFAHVDLGNLLVARGIAKAWPRGTPKPDWCEASEPR